MTQPDAPADQTPDQPRPPRRRWLRALRLILIVAVIAGVSWLVHARLAQPATPDAGGGRGRFRSNGPMPVATSKAERGDIDIIRNALGTVTSLGSVTVRTQLAGQLVEVLFQEGQPVKAGDLLARVDQRPYDLSLLQFQGQLVRDQALLAGAQRDLERYRTLAKQDSIASQQVDAQQTLVDQYQGAVAIDQAQVGTAQLDIAYCRITAPIAGRIGLRQVDAGNTISPSDANGIAVITQFEPISVLFSLPEDDLPAITRRLASGAKLQATALDRAGVAKIATGALATVDNLIDTTTGSVRFRAQFGNEDGALFPNQFVNVQLLVDTQRDLVVVPVSAVQRGAPGTFVYVVKDGATAAMRPVTLGATAGERVAIASGLEPDEVVVVDGGDKLRDGAQVVAKSADAPGRSRQPGAGDGSGGHHWQKSQPGQPAQPGPSGQHDQPAQPGQPDQPAPAGQPAEPGQDGQKPQRHHRQQDQ